jgi:hypothetical protein
MVGVLGMTLNGSAFACSKDGKDGFLPRNNRYIPTRRVVLDHDGNPVGGGITHEEFDGVITSVEKYYAPIVKAMGGNLVVHRNWDDGTVNAYADRDDGNWNLSMFGGLARHKETTIDAFLLVVCHELGHQIGGAPKINNGEGEWAANEGQSDYFATLKCARRVLQTQPNLHALPGLDAPDSVRIACRNSFKDDNQAAVCIRTSMAGLALARLLADLGGATTEDQRPFFTKPDTSVVTQTDDEHPAAQCRLDTYYAGSICPVDFKLNTDQVDPTVNTCSQERKDPLGFRPRCWYAPKADNTTKGDPNRKGPQHGHYL